PTTDDASVDWPGAAPVEWTANGIAYPNAWLRAKRAGESFTYYWGTNGMDWVVLAAITPEPAFPTTVLVGLGTTAQNDTENVSAFAQYKNFGNTLQIPAR